MLEEKLNKADGLAAQLVKMEQAHTYEQFVQIKDRLKNLLQGPGFASLARMFAIWIQFGTLPDAVTAYIKSSDPDTLTSFAVFANKAPSMQAITDRINGSQAQTR